MKLTPRLLARVDEDLDLTPPEELRARRIRRRVLTAGLFIGIFAVGGWYEARPASRAIKAWHSRRLAREASALIEKGEWKAADEKARDAYLLGPTEPETWRAIGRLLSRAGQKAAALEWWRKLEGAHKITIDDRREYAGSALAVDELATAATQIDALLAQPGGPTPQDKLFAGNLAVRRGESASALAYAERALGDSRARPNEVLSAAILALSVTAPDSASYASAWKRIEGLARNSANVMSLSALTFLSQQQAPTASSGGENSAAFSLAQTATAPPVTSLSAAEVADRLERHPKARSYHQLLAMKLRAREQPSRADELLNQAIARFRNSDDETLTALNTWLYTQKRYQTMVDIMPLQRALHGRELYLQYLDALGALGRFQEVRDLLSSERFRLDPVFQHMYLATAREQLKEVAGTANEWQRALEAAADANQCMALANYAERAGASAIADSAYTQAISFAPNLRAPYESRARLARARGETAKAKEILTQICRLSPEDDLARNDRTYLSLLLGASGADAERAVREAELLVKREPMNWQARATLSLAQLRLGHPAAALKAFSGIKAAEDSPVGPLAIRAVALDANGWKEAAKGDARTLAAAPLLPEERALIAPLLSD
ncbi:MAG: hypothetical protein ACR2II_10445 [Chthoniobacterales bacterium]